MTHPTLPQLPEALAYLPQYVQDHVKAYALKALEKVEPKPTEPGAKSYQDATQFNEGFLFAHRLLNEKISALTHAYGMLQHSVSHDRKVELEFQIAQLNDSIKAQYRDNGALNARCQMLQANHQREVHRLTLERDQFRAAAGQALSILTNLLVCQSDVPDSIGKEFAGLLETAAQLPMPLEAGELREATDYPRMKLVQPKLEKVPNGIKRLAWELEQVACGIGVNRQALLAAKALPVSPEENAMLERYLKDSVALGDQEKLIGLAEKIYFRGAKL